MIDRLICPTLALCAALVALLVLVFIIDYILCWGAAPSDEVMKGENNE